MFLRHLCCTICVVMMASVPCVAAPRQNTGAILSAIQHFLAATHGSPRGTIDLEFNPADLRLSLPDCMELQPFIPPGAPAWGNTVVGVRCAGKSNWTVMIPLNLGLTGIYLAAARQIDAGQTFTRSDFAIKEGNIAELPTDTMHEASQLIGKIASTAIDNGQILRDSMARVANSDKSDNPGKSDIVRRVSVSNRSAIAQN